MINNIKKRIVVLFNIDNPRSKAVIKGSFSMLISTLLANITRIATIVILSRFYSKEEFGIWATITATVAVIAYSDFGVVNALRNKLSQLIVLGDEGMLEAKKYFYSSLIFFFILCIFLSLAVVTISGFIPLDFFFKTDNQVLKSQGVRIILWVQFFFFLGIPLSMGGACFFSFHESKYSAFFGTIQAVLSFIVVLVFVLLKSSIVTISIAYFVTSTMMSLLSTIYFLWRRKWFSYDFVFNEFYQHIKELIKVGIKFMGFQLSNSFLQNAGTLLASSTIGLATAAEFNLVQKLYVFGTGIYQSMFNPVWGGYAEAATKRDWNWCKSTLRLSLIYTSSIFILVIIVMYFLGNYFLFFLAGKDYVSQRSLFLFLGTTSLFYILCAVTTTFQNSVNSLNTMVISTIIACFLIAPVSKYFVAKFDILGIAIATTLFWCIIAGIFIFESFYIIYRKQKNESYVINCEEIQSIQNGKNL